jgi:hypothetical protein
MVTMKNAASKNNVAIFFCSTASGICADGSVFTKRVARRDVRTERNGRSAGRLNRNPKWLGVASNARETPKWCPKFILDASSTRHGPQTARRNSWKRCRKQGAREMISDAQFLVSKWWSSKCGGGAEIRRAWCSLDWLGNWPSTPQTSLSLPGPYARGHSLQPPPFNKVRLRDPTLSLPGVWTEVHKSYMYRIVRNIWSFELWVVTRDGLEAIWGCRIQLHKCILVLHKNEVVSQHTRMARLPIHPPYMLVLELTNRSHRHTHHIWWF